MHARVRPAMYSAVGAVRRSRQRAWRPMQRGETLAPSWTKLPFSYVTNQRSPLAWGTTRNTGRSDAMVPPEAGSVSLSLLLVSDLFAVPPRIRTERMCKYGWTVGAAERDVVDKLPFFRIEIREMTNAL